MGTRTATRQKKRMWHYGDKEGAQQGPVDLTELQQLFTAGMISEVSPLWKDGMDKWLPVTELPGVLDKLREAARAATLSKQQFYTHTADKSEERSGPFTLSDLVDQWAEGVLTEADFLWSQSITEWTPVRGLPEVMEALADGNRVVEDMETIEKLYQQAAEGVAVSADTAVIVKPSQAAAPAEGAEGEDSKKRKYNKKELKKKEWF